MCCPLGDGSRTNFESAVVILNIKAAQRIQINSLRRWVRSSV